MSTNQTRDCATDPSECTNSAAKLVRSPSAGMGRTRYYCESCLSQLDAWGVEYEIVGEVQP